MIINQENVSTWKILLVDDEIDNLEVVSETLAFYGAEVKTARNGVEALALVENSYRPNLVLLDLSMPVMDGWITRQKLRENPSIEASTPIIALSAHAMLGDKERARNAGFDGYITKPVDVMSLIQTIRTALTQSD